MLNSYKIRFKLENVLTDFCRLRIKKYWKSEFKHNVLNPNLLTDEQCKSAKDFFSSYFKLDTLYHTFYTEKTG
jgi:hypothetical protein